MTDELHASNYTNPAQILAQRGLQRANRPTSTPTQEIPNATTQVNRLRRQPPKTTPEPSTPNLTRQRSNTIMATIALPGNRSTERPEEAREKLTVKDVCADLQITRSTLYEWIARQKAPKFTRLPNGSLRFDRTDYDVWYKTLELTA